MPETCNAPVEVKRAYAKRLPPQLAKDYGKRKRYSIEEIGESAKRAMLDIDFLCWGYVLFLDEIAFNFLHTQTGEACDYSAMHTEMGGYLAEAFGTSSLSDSNVDWSLFDPTSWSWPDVSDWFDFDIDLPDFN